MKNIIAILFCLLFVVACDLDGSADDKVREQTEQAMEEANKQVGMPAISNFQEKKLMKEIYELRDQEKLICYAYIVDMSGKLHFIGKCIGFGLPYSTQFSNPERKEYYHGGITLPQPEPNGLFMPEGLAATWLLLIDPETNKPRPVYIEPEIIVSPFPLEVE